MARVVPRSLKMTYHRQLSCNYYYVPICVSVLLRNHGRGFRTNGTKVSYQAVLEA